MQFVAWLAVLPLVYAWTPSFFSHLYTHAWLAVLPLLYACMTSCFTLSTYACVTHCFIYLYMHPWLAVSLICIYAYMTSCFTPLYMHRPIHSPTPFPLLSRGITSSGQQEGLWADLKQKGLVSIPLQLSIFFKKVVVCGHSLVVTLSLTTNETLKWLSSLPIFMQESFWWWQCSDRYILSLLLHTPSPFSPSLISLMVSVEVKHHLYQRASIRKATDLLRSLQSKYHVTFLSCLTVRFPKLQ